MYVHDAGSDSGGDNMQMVIIAVIVGALLLAVLIITALATSVGVLIWIRKRRKGITYCQISPIQAELFIMTSDPRSVRR